MLSVTKFLVVCWLLCGCVIAVIRPEGFGQQLVGSVEKLKDITNTCLENSPVTENGTFSEVFKQCVKLKVFECVDRVLDSPKIEIGSGVEFVKGVENTTSFAGVGDGETEKKMTASMSWPALITDRAEKVFQTHVLRVNLRKAEIFNDGARGAKHSFKLLFPLMVVIFMKMAAFMVPLGFQFMAMIGGKALLLSKMALLMASVQGLKGVAHSWPSYGSYQQPHHTGGSPHTDHHYSSGYGKSSV